MLFDERSIRDHLRFDSFLTVGEVLSSPSPKPQSERVSDRNGRHGSWNVKVRIVL